MLRYPLVQHYRTAAMLIVARVQHTTASTGVRTDCAQFRVFVPSPELAFCIPKNLVAYLAIDRNGAFKPT